MNQGATPQKKKSPAMMIVVIVLVIAVLALAGAMLYPKVKKSMDKKEAEKEDIYHAVFLSNGQVYFGKMYNSKDEYMKLSEVYYLQLNQQQTQQVQPAEGDTQSQDSSESKNPEFSLVKLGQELHGPENAMVINKDQVLFYEQLKTDSNVVKAIKEDKDKEDKKEEDKK